MRTTRPTASSGAACLRHNRTSASRLPDGWQATTRCVPRWDATRMYRGGERPATWREKYHGRPTWDCFLRPPTDDFNTYDDADPDPFAESQHTPRATEARRRSKTEITDARAAPGEAG